MKKKKWINLCFLLGVLVFLLAGLGRTLFRPKEINYYENRYAYTVGELSPESVLSGAFQDSMEKALSDQVLFAQSMKSSYYYLSTSFQKDALAGFLEANSDRYIKFLGHSTFGGEYLVYSPAWLSDKQAYLDARIENINGMVEAYPELEFYVYFIEKDTDIDFSTGRRTEASSYVGENLCLDPGHFAQFTVNDFGFYSENFYRTDHHWNCYGSYLGYTQLVELLCPGDEPLAPDGEKLLDYTFSGSKAVTSGGGNVFEERFPALHFSYPEMDITINGAAAADYGNQEAYWNGETTEKISYGAFYGNDAGEAVFDTHQEGRGNLLVLGESFDNAILKLLATHFDRLYAVDLRNYQPLLGVPFSLEQYVREHEISTVLLIGNVDYFVSTDFMLED